MLLVIDGRQRDVIKVSPEVFDGIFDERRLLLVFAVGLAWRVIVTHGIVVVVAAASVHRDSRRVRISVAHLAHFALGSLVVSVRRRRTLATHCVRSDPEMKITVSFRHTFCNTC